MTAAYLWHEKENKLARYETRVTICCTDNEETATAELLEESRAYAIDNIEFLNLYEVKEIDSPSRRRPVEVAHELTLAIDLETGRAIDREEFQRTRWESDRLDDCEKLGIAHAWHNLDGKRSGCNNCRVIRDGQLW